MWFCSRATTGASNAWRAEGTRGRERRPWVPSVYLDVLNLSNWFLRGMVYVFLSFVMFMGDQVTLMAGFALMCSGMRPSLMLLRPKEQRREVPRGECGGEYLGVWNSSSTAMGVQGSCTWLRRHRAFGSQRATPRRRSLFLPSHRTRHSCPPLFRSIAPHKVVYTTVDVLLTGVSHTLARMTSKMELRDLGPQQLLLSIARSFRPGAAGHATGQHAAAAVAHTAVQVQTRGG
jgi:hypothetical protein